MPGPPRPSPRGILAGTALAGAVFLALPRTGTGRATVYTLAAATLLALAVLALRRLPSRARRSWGLIVAGLAGYVLADVALTGRLAVTGETVPMGSLAHLGYPLGATLIAIALVRAVDRGREHDRAVLIDAAVAAISLGVVLWIVLVRPAGDALPPTVLGRSQLILYPLAHLLLLASAARLMLSDRRRARAWRRLLVGVAVLLGTVIVFGAVLNVGDYAPGGALDLGWLAAYGLLAAAVADPTAGRTARPPVEVRRLSTRRVAVLTVATLVLPAAGLVLAERSSDRLLAVATAALLLLITLRVWLLLRELERSRDVAVTRQRERAHHRLEALLQHATDVLLVVDHDRIAYATPSAPGLFGADPSGWHVEQLDEHLEDTDAHRLLLAATTANARPTDARIRGSDGSLHLVELVAVDLRHDPDVRGTVLTLHEITERTRLEAELRHLAFHDALTGLSNRELFLDRLTHARARTARHEGAWLAVLMCDLDDFKGVNDTLGHAAGDQLLMTVSQRMQSQVRAADTVARLGGDEFAILCEDVQGAGDAGATARRVLEAIRQPITLDGHELRVGTSIGVAVDDGSREVDELLRDADIALYEAKSEGKQRWSLHSRSMTVRAQERQSLSVDLADALERHDIDVAFQPIVALRTGVTTGFEALARWRHPDRGDRAPSEFVALAEDAGLVSMLGELVLRRSLDALVTWRGVRPDLDLTVCVNVSGRQVRDPGLVRSVARELQRAGLEGRNLMLELTESTMLDDTDQTHGVMRELRGRGVRFAIDDFGTGHSSLAHLHRLPIDRMNIDRSFVAELGVDAGSDGLVRAIVQLGRSLGLDVLAEGVETDQQRATLATMGCALAQGYLFRRPAPESDITRWLTHADAPGEPAPRPTGPRRALTDGVTTP